MCVIEGCDNSPYIGEFCAPCWKAEKAAYPTDSKTCENPDCRSTNPRTFAVALCASCWKNYRREMLPPCTNPGHDPKVKDRRQYALGLCEACWSNARVEAAPPCNHTDENGEPDCTTGRINVRTGLCDTHYRAMLRARRRAETAAA